MNLTGKWRTRLIASWLVSAALLAGALGLGANTASAQDLRATFNSEWAPYSFGSRDKVQGILPDLLDAVLAGVPNARQVRHGQAWATVERSVRRSRYDAFVTTPTPERLKFSERSQEVLYTVQMVPVVKKGGPMEALLAKDLSQALRDARICGIKGNGWEEKYYAGLGIRYVKMKNVSRCFDKIVAGTADVIIQARAVALKNITDRGLSDDLAVSKTPVSEVGFPLLVRNTYPNVDAVLTAFDTHLSDLKASGKYDRLVEEIVNNWANQ